MGDAAKSLAIWAGVVAVALAYLPFSALDASTALAKARTAPLIVLGVGITLFAMSLALQYGLSRLPANRAIVILLSELVVAAIAAYLLAGEVMRPQDWFGGALIVVAACFPARRAAAAPSPSSDARPRPW
jgi:drug/metabolite transporter (DMT)-like permease